MERRSPGGARLLRRPLAYCDRAELGTRNAARSPAHPLCRSPLPRLARGRARCPRPRRRLREARERLCDEPQRSAARGSADRRLKLGRIDPLRDDPARRRLLDINAPAQQHHPRTRRRPLELRKQARPARCSGPSPTSTTSGPSNAAKPNAATADSAKPITSIISRRSHTAAIAARRPTLHATSRGSGAAPRRGLVVGPPLRRGGPTWSRAGGWGHDEAPAPPGGMGYRRRAL
jgi:hypothetical protein